MRAALAGLFAFPLVAWAHVDRCAALVSGLRELGVHATPFGDGVEYVLTRIDAWAASPLPESAEPVFVSFTVGLPDRGKTFLSAAIREGVEARHGQSLQVFPVHGLDDRDVAVVKSQMEQRRRQYFPAKPRFVLVVEAPTAPIPGLTMVHEHKARRAFGDPPTVHLSLVDPMRDVTDPTVLIFYDAVVVNPNARPKL